MSEVWESYPLQSLVIKVGSGSTPKGGSEAYKAVGIPLIRSMNVVFFGFKRAGLAYIDADQAAQLDNATVKAGDVLLNITGASIGRVTLAPDEFDGARVNQHVCIIRPNEALDARFLNAYLSSPALQSQIWNDNFGVTRQALTKQQILDFEVPVPSRFEQTRIVNQLNTLLTRIQSCNDRLDAIPDLLKRFRQAVLDAATKGELTAVWREGHGDPIWEKTEIGKCGVISGGLTKNSKREDLNLRKPYLRVANVQSNRLDLSDVAEIGLTQPEYEKTKLQKDDLLIVEGNGSIDQVGRVAIWSNELEDCVHQNHLIRLRTVGPLARWVLLWLQSTPGRESLMELASTTTGLYTLSISKISSVPIQLPSQAEQTEIIRRVGALFAIADRIEARTNEARAHAQRLSPLVLAKAFRGELVPHDPQDESASELLIRIATAQSLEPIKRTAKTATRRTSKIKPRGVNTSLRGDEPLEENMKLDLVPGNYLESFISDAQGVSAKDLWQKSKLVIDDFYAQLSREINLGLIEVDIHDESRIYRSATSQRGQQ